MSHRTAYVASPGEALLGRVFPHRDPSTSGLSTPASTDPLVTYPPTPATDDDSETDADEKEFRQAEALLARNPTSNVVASERWSNVAALQNWSRFLTQRSVTRRLVLVAVAVTIVIVSLYGAAGPGDGQSSDARLGTLSRLGSTPGRLKEAVYDRWTNGIWSSSDSARDPNDYEPLNMSHILKYDTPRPSMKEQLKPGVRYIVANAYGGHANQFIGIQKMLYFGKLTNRVGIIPTLIPVHLSGAPENISAFYDLDRFWQESHIPAVEFSRLKAADPTFSQPVDEHISCWSVYEACVGSANQEIAAFTLHRVGLQYWPLPRVARALGNFDLSYDGLRIFDFDQAAKNEWIARVQREHLPQLPVDGEFDGDPATNIKPAFAPGFGERLAPVEQLMCFDVTLFLGPIMFPELPVTPQPLEPKVPGEGLSWMNAGQYLRFNNHVESRADELLVELFGVRKASKIPPFITIHLRRGDFKEFAGFTDLDKYIDGLARVRARLQDRLDHPNGWAGPGKHAFRSFGRKAKDYPVVCTTDERGDSDFIRKVKGLGWKVVDHDAYDTVNRFGAWWPTMLDGAILARGKSFVGTDRSTYSHLAGLRVKYWNGGVVEVAV